MDTGMVTIQMLLYPMSLLLDTNLLTRCYGSATGNPVEIRGGVDGLVAM